jgi:hypothetical protein
MHDGVEREEIVNFIFAKKKRVWEMMEEMVVLNFKNVFGC